MSSFFPREISLNDITFTEPKAFGETVAKIVYVQHKGAEMQIQCPTMTTPFGLGKFDDGNRVKYSLDMSFRDKEKNVKLETLHTFLNEFDKKVLEHAVENSKAWFKKKMSREVLNELMTPSVKYPKDKETGEISTQYPATFKTKVVQYENRFTRPVFHMDTKQLLEGDWNDLITKGSSVVAIVRHGGIWFAGGKFGSIWQIEQLKLRPADKIAQYAFKDDDSDVQPSETHSQEENENNGDDENYVLDSEDENDL